MPMPQSSPPDEESYCKVGTIGNALAGGGIGAMLSTKMIKPKVDASDVSTEGLKNIKIPANVKSIGMTALKAGGIGAGIGGVISGVENFMKLSRNEITGARQQEILQLIQQ